jgi:HPt (histidine-containing phosphotransfer) domain-containing protein
MKNYEELAPPLSLPVAMQCVGEDASLLREIASIFLDTIPGMMERIRDAVHRGDLQEVYASAHALKGAAANFGALPMVEAAKSLEWVGRQGSLPQAAAKLADLEDEMLRLKPLLARWAEGDLST